MDILDTLDEIEDDEFQDDENVLDGDELDELTELDDEFPTANTSVSEELVEFDDALSLDDYEMTAEQATEITEAIKSAATATYVLLRQAHDHKAHKALGYETWEDYVRKEFEISAQRSYQLLHLERTIAMIEEATPEGTEVKLTEKQARDIKRELPRITERIQEETHELTPEDAAARAAEILKEEQAEVKAQAAAEDKAKKAKEAEREQAEMDGYQAGIEAAADALLEADRPDGITDRADDGLLEMEVDGNSEISQEDTLDVYNFFNMLGALGSLPSPDEFVNKVPVDREEEVEAQIMEATAWLNRFVTLWEMRNES